MHSHCPATVQNMYYCLLVKNLGWDHIILIYLPIIMSLSFYLISSRYLRYLDVCSFLGLVEIACLWSIDSL
jgi:hypothetical protein